jgi:WD40 repeat protein
MGDVFLTSRAGELPSSVVYQDGVIVCVYNQPVSRSADPASPSAPRTPFTAVAVDALGERVAACDRSGNLLLFDLSSQRYRRVRNMTVEGTQVAFSARFEDGLYVALADATARCYNAQTGDMVVSLAGHRSEVTALAQSGDGSSLLTVSSDVALVWGTGDWTRKRSLGSPAGIAHAAIAASAGHLAVAFRDDTIYVWDGTTYDTVARLRLTDPEAGAELRAIAAADDGSVVVAASGKHGCVYVWDVPSSALVRIIDAPSPAKAVVQVAVISSAVATAQARALAESQGGEGSQGGSSSSSSGVGSGAAFGPAPPQVVMLDDTGRLLIVELGPQVCTAVLELEAPGGRGTITSFSLSRDARLLALTTDDGRIILYDVPQARVFRMEMTRSTGSGAEGQAEGGGAAGGDGGGRREENNDEEEDGAGSLAFAPLDEDASGISANYGGGRDGAASSIAGSMRGGGGGVGRGAGAATLSEDGSAIEMGSLPPPGLPPRPPSRTAQAAPKAPAAEVEEVAIQTDDAAEGEEEEDGFRSAPGWTRRAASLGEGEEGEEGAFPPSPSAQLSRSSSVGRRAASTAASSAARAGQSGMGVGMREVPARNMSGSSPPRRSQFPAPAPAPIPAAAASSSSSSFYTEDAGVEGEGEEDNEPPSLSFASEPFGARDGRSSSSAAAAAAAAARAAGGPPADELLREGVVAGLMDPRQAARQQSFVDGFGGRDRGAGSVARAGAAGAASIGARAGITGGVPGSEMRYATAGAVRASVGPSPDLAGPPGAPLHDLIGRATAVQRGATEAASGAPRVPPPGLVPPEVVESSASVTHRKLVALLDQYGAFPAKYRMQAWRFLLRLPRNAEALSALTARGAHPGWDDLEARYPVTDRRLLGRLARVVSALAHWSPVFGEVPFLPVLAFPFVKFFGADDEVCTEAVMAVLVNWGAHFVETLPHPPVPLLGRLHALLAHWDPQLAAHLEACGADPVRYAWPMLRSAFSEVLTRDEWETLWDHLFAHAHDPSLLLYACVAYLRYFRGPLLGIRAPDSPDLPRPHPGGRPGHGQGGLGGPFGTGSRDSVAGAPFLSRAAGMNGAQSALASRVVTPALAEVCTFLRHQNPVNVRGVLRLMYGMRAATPPSAHPFPVAHADRGMGQEVGESQAVPTAQAAPASEVGAPNSGPLHPLPSGHYPPFLRYPSFVVDFQLAERRRIAKEEEALLQRRAASTLLATRAAELAAEEQALRAERAMMARADARRAAEMEYAGRVRELEVEELEREVESRKAAAVAAALDAARGAAAEQRVSGAALAARSGEELRRLAETRDRVVGNRAIAAVATATTLRTEVTERAREEEWRGEGEGDDDGGDAARRAAESAAAAAQATLDAAASRRRYAREEDISAAASDLSKSGLGSGGATGRGFVNVSGGSTVAAGQGGVAPSRPLAAEAAAILSEDGDDGDEGEGEGEDDQHPAPPRAVSSPLRAAALDATAASAASRPAEPMSVAGHLSSPPARGGARGGGGPSSAVAGAAPLPRLGGDVSVSGSLSRSLELAEGVMVAEEVARAAAASARGGGGGGLGFGGVVEGVRSVAPTPSLGSKTMPVMASVGGEPGESAQWGGDEDGDGDEGGRGEPGSPLQLGPL